MKLAPKISIMPQIFPWELWRFHKNADFIAAMKKYPGTKWDPKEQGWLVPEDVSPLVRKDPSFAEVNFDILAEPFEVPIKDPALHPYQNVGASRLWNNHGGILNMAPGLGKTATTIAALKHFQPPRVLVVCPAVVRRTWVKELDFWWPEHPEVKLVEGSTSFGVGPITITSYNMFHKFTTTRFDAIVFDELHYLKEARTKRTKQAFELRAANPDAIVIGLTGTLIPNAAKDLWSQVEAVHPGVFGTFWKFAYRYCNIIDDGDYKEIVGLNPANEAELRERLSRLAYTVTREEVAHLLPPYSFSTRYIPAKRALKIEDLDKFLEATVPQKITSTAEIVEEFRGNGRKHICVLSLLHRTTHDLANKLRQAGFPNVATVTGELDQAKRYEILESQSKHDVSVTVCSMGSIGTGLNALTFVETAIFAELPWSPGALLQVIRRFNRLSSKHAAEIVFLVIESSRDEQVCATVIDKCLQVETLQPGATEKPLEARTEMSEEDFLAQLNGVLG